MRKRDEWSRGKERESLYGMQRRCKSMSGGMWLATKQGRERGRDGPRSPAGVVRPRAAPLNVPRFRRPLSQRQERALVVALELADAREPPLRRLEAALVLRVGWVAQLAARPAADVHLRRERSRQDSGQECAGAGAPDRRRPRPGEAGAGPGATPRQNTANPRASNTNGISGSCSGRERERRAGAAAPLQDPFLGPRRSSLRNPEGNPRSTGGGSLRPQWQRCLQRAIGTPGCGTCGRGM